MIGFWSRTKSECLFWIRKLYRHILYIIFLRTNIGSLRIGNFGHFWTYSTPLLQTTILNRKHYVPSNFFSKDSFFPFTNLGNYFFLRIKPRFSPPPKQCDYPPVTNRLLVGFDFDTLGGMTFSSPRFTRQVLGIFDGSFGGEVWVFFTEKIRWMDHRIFPN